MTGHVTPATARRLLGVDGGADARVIRRAYADALRAMDPDADPEGFARLRAARDAALTDARARADSRAGGEVEREPGDGADPAGPEDIGSGEAGPEDVGPDAVVAQAHRIPLPVPPPAAGSTGGVPGAGAPAEMAGALSVSEPPTAPPDAYLAPFAAELAGAGTGARAVEAAVLSAEAVDALASALAPAARPADDAETHAGALYALLMPDGADGPLDEDERRRMLDAFDGLLATPRMEEIEYRRSAELWLADLAADAGARADPLLPRMVEAFGWEATRGRLDQPAAVAAVLERWDETSFVAEVTAPGHPWHRAWTVLTGGHKGVFGPRVRNKRTRTLLAHVRAHHPELEMRFDPALVERADGGGGLQLGGRQNMVLVVVLLIALLRFCAALQHDAGRMPFGTPTSAPVSTGLTDPRADIDPVLKAVGNEGLSLAMLATLNPRYHDRLVADWDREAKGRNDRAAYEAALIGELGERQVTALRQAPRDLVVRARRLQMDQFVFVRDRYGAERCGGMLSGRPAPDAAVERFRERRQMLAGDVLTQMDGVPEASTETTFRVPKTVVRDAAAQTGMTPEQFSRALDRKAGDADACRAWIALYDAALDTPGKRGLELLRAM